uniref:Uncharacterized protein n=1 Tax=Anguilla anguilla TaxID=7936 RepID=A0A0E9X7A7_ANGAN
MPIILVTHPIPTAKNNKNVTSPPIQKDVQLILQVTFLRHITHKLPPLRHVICKMLSPKLMQIVILTFSVDISLNCQGRTFLFYFILFFFISCNFLKQVRKKSDSIASKNVLY